LFIKFMEDNFERFMIGQKAALIRDDKCLIVEISDQSGMWELPGGRLDKGEFREAALRREIKEELGLDRVDILGVVDYDIWYHKEKNIPFCGTVHLIKNDKGEIILSSESSQYKWITENEIDSYNYYWDVSPRFIRNSFKLYEMLKNNEK
jgi:8-oxo-dGTP diphosphatase